MNNIKKVLFAILFTVIASAGFAQNFKANHNTDDSLIIPNIAQKSNNEWSTLLAIVFFFFFSEGKLED